MVGTNSSAGSSRYGFDNTAHHDAWKAHDDAWNGVAANANGASQSAQNFFKAAEAAMRDLTALRTAARDNRNLIELESQEGIVNVCATAKESRPAFIDIAAAWYPANWPYAIIASKRVLRKENERDRRETTFAKHWFEAAQATKLAAKLVDNICESLNQFSTESALPKGTLPNLLGKANKAANGMKKAMNSHLKIADQVANESWTLVSAAAREVVISPEARSILRRIEGFGSRQFWIALTITGIKAAIYEDRLYCFETVPLNPYGHPELAKKELIINGRPTKGGIWKNGLREVYPNNLPESAHPDGIMLVTRSKLPANSSRAWYRIWTCRTRSSGDIKLTEFTSDELSILKGAWKFGSNNNAERDRRCHLFLRTLYTALQGFDGSRWTNLSGDERCDSRLVARRVKKVLSDSITRPVSTISRIGANAGSGPSIRTRIHEAARTARYGTRGLRGDFGYTKTPSNSNDQETLRPRLRSVEPRRDLLSRSVSRLTRWWIKKRGRDLAHRAFVDDGQLRWHLLQQNRERRSHNSQMDNQGSPSGSQAEYDVVDEDLADTDEDYNDGYGDGHGDDYGDNVV